MAFRDTGTPVRDIGRELGVDAVLEGSVRQSGETVRVTVQLIDAATESHLWADSFEHDFTDILKLQSEVAVTVAREVRGTLTSDEERRLSNTRMVNEEAYRLYLQAVRLSPWITSEQNLEEAKDLFERAIDIDPTYAEAYLGQSRTLLQLSTYYRPPSEFMPAALAAVERALELDPDLSAAHSRLGSIKHWWQWDLTAAEAAYRRGVQLNPNGGFELVRYAELLAITGRSEEAIALAKKAVELDPLNADTLAQLGWVCYLSRHFDEGIEHMSYAREMYPSNVHIAWQLAVNQGGAKRFEDAAQELSRVIDLYPRLRRNSWLLSSLALLTGKSGNIEVARRYCSETLNLADDQYVPYTHIAMAYLSVDEIDRAFDYFQRAFEEHETGLMGTISSAIVDSLRSDARFQRIYRAMGLRDEWQ
jgi:tetratricopeptide (TPR) repeat protein